MPKVYLLSELDAVNVDGDERLYVTDDPTGTPSDAYVTVDTVREYVGSGFLAASAGDLYATEIQAINVQTGTTYTPVLADAGKMVTGDNAATIAVTLPQDSDEAFPIGSSVDFMQIGAGQMTFTAGTGATVNLSASFTAAIAEQYGVVAAYKRAADTWVLIGSLEIT